MIRFNRTISPIKVLSFDLDDTLYNNHPIIAGALQAQHNYLANLPKWHAQGEQFWQQCRHAVVKAQPQLADNVTLWRQHALAYGMEKVGLSQEHAELAYHAFANARSQISVSDEVLQLLSALKQQYTLIAITNGNADVSRFNLNGMFNAVFLAGEHGKAKPANDLFLRAAKQLQVKPNEILHIGDSLDTDVQGANLAGCHSVWLNDQGLEYGYKGLADIEISNIFALKHFCQ